MANRRKRKKESSAKTLFLALIAIVVMVCAISIVVSVFKKISGDYEALDLRKPTETSSETIAIENEPVTGWKQTDDGYVYINEDQSYVKDTWKEIEGFLYHFDENGIMATGEWSSEGQIFTCSDKGYLKDIQTDLTYQPPGNGENLDSLVKANAFWCYLGESDGAFKPILYRKATENKILTMGGEAFAERTTRNSMKAQGDYLYYLPKVKSGQAGSLTEAELKLCDSLFRTVPGSGEKELIAEHVGGYLLLDGKIYYSQGGKIQSATSGTKIPLGQKQFSVIVKDDSCYLVDAMNNPVEGDSSGFRQIGDRLYRIEDSQGKIKYVKHAEESVGGYTYYMDNVSGGYPGVLRKDSSGAAAVVRETYGVQSYCIANQEIYYSAYVEKDGSGEWHSQIFKTALDGSNRQAVSERFPGMMGNMYYYEDAGEIYAEYHPAIWNNAYGKIAVISLEGSISTIDDEIARMGKSVSDNDMLELVMVDGNVVTALWHDVVWNRTTGITSTLWSKAIQMKNADRTMVQTGASGTGGEGEQTPPETTAEEIIKPVGDGQIIPPDGGKPTMPQTEAETVSPDANKPTMPQNPTAPQVPAATDEVKIVPIGP